MELEKKISIIGAIYLIVMSIVGFTVMYFTQWSDVIASQESFLKGFRYLLKEADIKESPALLGYSSLFIGGIFFYCSHQLLFWFNLEENEEVAKNKKKTKEDEEGEGALYTFFFLGCTFYITTFVFAPIFVVYGNLIPQWMPFVSIYQAWLSILFTLAMFPVISFYAFAPVFGLLAFLAVVQHFRIAADQVKDNNKEPEKHCLKEIWEDIHKKETITETEMLKIESAKVKLREEMKENIGNIKWMPFVIVGVIADLVRSAISWFMNWFIELETDEKIGFIGSSYLMLITTVGFVVIYFTQWNDIISVRASFLGSVIHLCEEKPTVGIYIVLFMMSFSFYYLIKIIDNDEEAKSFVLMNILVHFITMIWAPLFIVYGESGPEWIPLATFFYKAWIVIVSLYAMLALFVIFMAIIGRIMTFFGYESNDSSTSTSVEKYEKNECNHRSWELVRLFPWEGTPYSITGCKAECRNCGAVGRLRFDSVIDDHVLCNIEK